MTAGPANRRVCASGNGLAATTYAAVDALERALWRRLYSCSPRSFSLRRIVLLAQFSTGHLVARKIDTTPAGRRVANARRPARFRSRSALDRPGPRPRTRRHDGLGAALRRDGVAGRVDSRPVHL